MQRHILIENRYLALYDLIIVYFNEIRHNTSYGSIVQKNRAGRRQEHDKQIILHIKLFLSMQTTAHLFFSSNFLLYDTSDDNETILVSHNRLRISISCN